MLRLTPRIVVALALFGVGCSPSNDPPMTRSCRGEYVNECRPYDYARITNATLTPSRITLNDPSMHAMVHVEFTRCDMASLPLYVQLSAFVGGSSDGSVADPLDSGVGSDARVIPLTMIGPADTGATSLDVTIPNPFFADVFTSSVPANSHITLQFAPVIDDCEGDLFSTDYLTGSVITMP